jgi:hypothetical protein
MERAFAAGGDVLWISSEPVRKLLAQPENRVGKEKSR